MDPQVCPRAQAAQTTQELQQGNQFWRNSRNVAGWNAWMLLQGHDRPTKTQSSLDFSSASVSATSHGWWGSWCGWAAKRLSLGPGGSLGHSNVGAVLVLSQQDEFLNPVAPHCTKQGEITRGKAKPAFQSGHGWGWSKTPSYQRDLSKLTAGKKEAKLGLVTAARRGDCGELGQGRAQPPPGLFWFCSVGATGKSTIVNKGLLDCLVTGQDWWGWPLLAEHRLRLEFLSIDVIVYFFEGLGSVWWVHSWSTARHKGEFLPRAELWQDPSLPR